MKARVVAVIAVVAACFAGCSALVSFDDLTSIAGGDASSSDAKSPGNDGQFVSDATGGGGDGARDGNTSVSAPAILAIGGSNGTSYSSDVLIATPAADGGLSEWTALPSLPSGSFRGNAVTLGNSIYVMPGGKSPGSSYSDQFELTRFSSGTTSSYVALPAFPNPRYRAGAAASGSTLVIAGGWSDTNPAMSDTRWGTIDDAGIVNTWNFGPDLPSQRSGLCVASSGSFIFSAGGGVVTEAGEDEASTDVYMARIAADGSLSSWSTEPSLIIATQSCAAVVVNGYLYVVGGYVSSGPVQFAKINSDGSLAAFATTTALNHPRAIFGLVAVGNILYAIGGDFGNPMSFVESAVVSSDGTIAAWNDTTPLPAPRSGLSAVSFGAF